MQFTRGTADWMGSSHCKSLGAVNLYNPRWQIACAVRYMALLELQNLQEPSEAMRRKAAERGYNGGQGWLNRERRALGRVAHSIDDCRVTGRAIWACEENMAYPGHISRRQPKYKDYGGVMMP